MTEAEPTPGTQEAHARLVQIGYCPAIYGPYRAGLWCALRAGHAGLHRAPYLAPGQVGQRQAVWLTWEVEQRKQESEHDH